MTIYTESTDMTQRSTQPGFPLNLWCIEEQLPNFFENGLQSVILETIRPISVLREKLEDFSSGLLVLMPKGLYV